MPRRPEDLKVVIRSWQRRLRGAWGCCQDILGSGIMALRFRFKATEVEDDRRCMVNMQNMKILWRHADHG